MREREIHLEPSHAGDGFARVFGFEEVLDPGRQCSPRGRLHALRKLIHEIDLIVAVQLVELSDLHRVDGRRGARQRQVEQQGDCGS